METFRIYFGQWLKFTLWWWGIVVALSAIIIGDLWMASGSEQAALATVLLFLSMVDAYAVSLILYALFRFIRYALPPKLGLLVILLFPTAWLWWVVMMARHHP